VRRFSGIDFKEVDSHKDRVRVPKQNIFAIVAFPQVAHLYQPT
jgi:hypothetical protein